jgi:hypothetical protein
MNDGSWSRSSRIAFVVALVLVFGGGLLASLVQTGGGLVSVRDIRFVGSGGPVMSALLFVPPGVSAEHPAPGVLAIHGYINTRETLFGTDQPVEPGRRDGSLAGAMVRNMLLVQYLPLLRGGTLSLPAEPLLTIVASQFVVLLPVVGLLSTNLFRRTGSIYAGAFVDAGLIAWIVVASQATHFAL